MGDPVLRLGLPARVVGRLRGERPRGDARRRPGRRGGRRRAGRDRAAHAPPRGRAGRRADPHEDAPRRRGRADAGRRRPRPRSSSGPRTTPTTRRSWPPPRTCRPSPRRSPAISPSPSARRPWDVVDLRRLRCGDPAADALAAAFGAREIAEGWTLNVEREDVCPVVDPAGRRRRWRLPRDARQEGAPRDPAQGPARRGRRRGPVRRLAPTRWPTSRPFIDLHQRKWGADGLFPDTPGGAQSRVFFRRLFELHGDRRPAPARRSCRSAAGASRPASTSRPPTRLPLLQRRRRPRRPRPVAGRPDGPRHDRARPRGRASAGSTSCAATSRTSTSGARSTSPIQRLLVRRRNG